jgi:hypothetical protein
LRALILKVLLIPTLAATLWCGGNVCAQETNASLNVSVFTANGAQGVLWGTTHNFYVYVTNAGPAAAREVLVDVQVTGGIVRRNLGLGRGGGVPPLTGMTSLTTCRQSSAVLETGEIIGVELEVLAAGPGPVEVHSWARAMNDPTEDQAEFLGPLYFSQFSESRLAINADDTAYDRRRGIIYLYEKWSGTVWPIAGGQPHIFDPIQTGQRGRIALSADGDALYVGMHLRGVTRIDTRTGEQTQVLWTNFSGTAFDIAVSPTDSTLVAVSHSGGTQLIHGSALLPQGTSSYGAIAFTEDGTKLILNDADKVLLRTYEVTDRGLVLVETRETAAPNDFERWGTKLYFHWGPIYDLATGQVDNALYDGHHQSFAEENVINRLVDTNAARRIQRLDRRTLQQIQVTGHFSSFVNPSTVREAGEHDLVVYGPVGPFGGGGTYWVNLAPQSARLRMVELGDSILVRISHLQPNQRYRLERTERLDSASWVMVSEGSGPGDTVVAPSLATPTRAFYRVVAEP